MIKLNNSNITLMKNNSDVKLNLNNYKVYPSDTDTYKIYLQSIFINTTGDFGNPESFSDFAPSYDYHHDGVMSEGHRFIQEHYQEYPELYTYLFQRYSFDKEIPLTLIYEIPKNFLNNFPGHENDPIILSWLFNRGASDPYWTDVVWPTISLSTGDSVQYVGFEASYTDAYKFTVTGDTIITLS